MFALVLFACGGAPLGTDEESLEPTESGDTPNDSTISSTNPATRPTPGFGQLTLTLTGYVDSDLIVVAESSSGEMIMTQPDESGFFSLTIDKGLYYKIRFEEKVEGDEETTQEVAVLTFDADSSAQSSTNIFYAGDTVDSNTTINLEKIDVYTDGKAYPAKNPLTCVDSDKDGIPDRDDPDTKKDKVEKYASFAEEGTTVISEKEGVINDLAHTDQKVEKQDSPSTEEPVSPPAATSEEKTDSQDQPSPLPTPTSPEEKPLPPKQEPVPEKKSTEGQKLGEIEEEEGLDQSDQGEETKEAEGVDEFEQEKADLLAQIEDLKALRDESQTMKKDTMALLMKIKKLTKDIKSSIDLAQKDQLKLDLEAARLEMATLNEDFKAIKEDYNKAFKETIGALKQFRRKWKDFSTPFKLF